MKYPVLVERIIQNTEGEKHDLLEALILVTFDFFHPLSEELTKETQFTPSNIGNRAKTGV